MVQSVNHIKDTLNIPSIVAIVLAAGASRRMGYPKQLLKFREQSLLHHSLSVALAVCREVTVVTGANAERIKKEMKGSAARISENKNWREGMASSIKTGLQDALLQNPSLEAVILMVCDQPFVSEKLVKELLLQYRKTKKPIIASAYKGTLGIPVIFNKKYFPELLNLKGTSGAKKVITHHLSDTFAVPFPLGYVDIDSTEDYERLQSDNFGPEK